MTIRESKEGDQYARLLMQKCRPKKMKFLGIAIHCEESITIS